ncbi:hypothetical protein MRB53_000572 [Persea americana]|uniref:Uncharacterized protein n=1 Tax=Persea americana TaxID=3435 RepID=A0ACC2MQ96_PERAE|nr:hypothetical protein MRB53_000572 [Persea americana]
MGGVGVHSLRLWLCFFFTFFIICHARPLILLSGNDLRLEGRSLTATLDDHNDPSANHGHDHRTRIVGGGSGKKNRGSPDAP